MKPSFLSLLRALHDHQVEIVVVGGVAALIEGAPITTLDLDVVYRIDDDNPSRMLGALESLGARYRDPAGRQIFPTLESLSSNRVNLLETSAGLLDAMQEIGDGWRYDDLVSRAHRRSLGDLEVRVLDLAAVIESKEASGRPKDRAMLPVLRATLAERRRLED